jgi:outer membrane protein assembly factor BamB
MTKRYVAALILLLAAIPQLALADGDTNWVTRGKTNDRVQMTTEALGPISAVEAWAEPARVGATGSQPLLVGNRIYHLAGGGLWQITPDGQPEKLTDHQNHVRKPDGTWTQRPSTSGLTYREIDGQGVLYYGTGNNQVCAYRLALGNHVCHALTDPLETEAPIVTVPLVLTKPVQGRTVDIAIMGDKRGRVWAIQGLAKAASPADIQAAYQEVGGWVLASPVQIGRPGELAFLWASTNARIDALQVLPADGTQPLRFQRFWSHKDHVDVYAGVADGFAKVDTFAYASDTAGNFYEIYTQDGTKRQNLHAKTAGPMFANAAPAVDDQHIYFTIRNVGTATPSTTHPGRLVALDRQTFTVKWTADLDAPANTNPLVWAAGPKVVLVGDTKGTLYSFDIADGKPRPFAVQGCTPVAKLSLGTVQQLSDEAYQTTTGISEPILASGSLGYALLLAGISGRDENGAPAGHLTAFRSGGAYNVAWTSTGLPPGETALGQTYPIRGSLVLDPWNITPPGPRMVGVRAYWVSDDGASRPISELRQVTLAPGVAQPVSFSFTPTEADGTSGRVIVVANPEQVIYSSSATGDTFRSVLTAAGDAKAAGVQQAVDKGDYASVAALAAGGYVPGNCAGAEAELLPAGPDAAMADNLLVAPLAIAQQVDLVLASLQVPESYPCYTEESSTWINWTVQNPSARVLRDVAYRITVNGEVVETGVRSLKPGESRGSTRIALPECSMYYTVKVEINQPRSVPEPTYANNSRTGELFVEAEQESGGSRPVLTRP